jgi:hypothetical protein
VNGLRTRKGFLRWLRRADADILGVQEVRALPEELLSPRVRSPRGFATTCWRRMMNTVRALAFWSEPREDGPRQATKILEIRPQELVHPPIIDGGVDVNQQIPEPRHGLEAVSQFAIDDLRFVQRPEHVGVVAR